MLAKTVYAPLITLFEVLTSPTSVNDAKVSYSSKEKEVVQQSTLSKQACKNNGVNQDTRHQALFSKDNKRKAHVPANHRNTPGKAHQVSSFSTC